MLIAHVPFLAAEKSYPFPDFYDMQLNLDRQSNFSDMESTWSSRAGSPTRKPEVRYLKVFHNGNALCALSLLETSADPWQSHSLLVQNCGYSFNWHACAVSTLIVLCPSV